MSSACTFPSGNWIVEKRTSDGWVRITPHTSRGQATLYLRESHRHPNCVRLRVTERKI